MATPSNRDLDSLVQQILAEADGPETPTVDQLRARVALLSPAEQTELLDEARRRNAPLLASSTPPVPPPPGVIERRRSTAGA